MPSAVAEQPVSPPIWLTSDYLYEGTEHYADVINERRPGYVYGRYGNPTHTALHRVLASLESAEAAWSFGSGMAALHTALTSLLRSDDHLVAQRTIYGGTFALLTEVFPGYGIETTFAEPEAEAVASAFRPNTRAVLIETLANPTFRVPDVAGIGRVCRERGMSLVVDNSVATPYLVRPLEIEGVSLVVSSTTKYLGGHSDLIGGSVAGPRDAIDRVRRLALEQGTTGGAFEAWLTLRGVQTLALRMERQCSTAMRVAELLAGLEKVTSVGYPGLASHVDHQRASGLFDGGRFGAMLSFTLRDGYESVVRVCDSLRVARVGSSFGSMHSQVCHPSTTTHRQLSAAEREAAGIGDGLVRVAVGGEDAGDLLEDFARALEKA
jgi:cystathionine beta-lyase/cystathionine gamma-synthase